MEHLLAPNIKNLSDDELVNKINELHRKATLSRGNYNLLGQVQMMIEHYQGELHARYAQREKEAMEELGDEDFYSDKIDIS